VILGQDVSLEEVSEGGSTAVDGSKHVIYSLFSSSPIGLDGRRLGSSKWEKRLGSSITLPTQFLFASYTLSHQQHTQGY
jgi:hypothetical protein